MSMVHINGIDLYYEDYGEGMPLVLIAGLASDSQSWQPIIEKLSLHYRVIVFDNRGIGRTKISSSKIYIHDIADDCIALIKYLDIHSVYLLGHSMGGFVALDCAIRYPQYISKLILAGTSALNSERNNTLFSDWSSYREKGMDLESWFRNIFFWILTQQFFNDKEVLNNALQFVIEYPYPQTEIAFSAQVDAIKEFNCSKSLALIRSETLVVYGREDLLFPPTDSSKVLQAIPNVRFSYIDHAAHSIHSEEAEKFITIIQDFLTDK